MQALQNKLIILGQIVIALFFASCNSGFDNKNQNNIITDSLVLKENILKTDSLNLPLIEQIAVDYYNRKNYEKSVFYLKKLCDIDTDNVMGFITLGNTYYDAKNFKDAIPNYEKALIFDNSNTNVRCDLATCYLNIENANKALELLLKNLEINPNHLQTHHNLSVVYSKLGKVKESEKEFENYNNLLNGKN